IDQITVNVAIQPTAEVTTAAGANGTVNPSGVTKVNNGGSLTLTAFPVSCHSVDKWYTNSVLAQMGGTVFALLNVTGNMNVSVTFAQLPYTINTSSTPSNSGTTTGDGIFGCGSNVTVTAA